MTDFLTPEDLLTICRRMGYGPVRDVGLLASAAARPATTIAGSEAYPTMVEQASALLESLCCNHALVDGNKRLGLHAVAVLLDLNGYGWDLDLDERFHLVLDVAAGTLRGVPAIAARIRIRPLPTSRP